MPDLATVIQNLGVTAGIVLVVYLFLQYLREIREKAQAMSQHLGSASLLDDVIIQPQPVFDVREVTVPLSQTVDYGVALHGCDKLHAQGYRGKGITVAVVDTGIADHPDLGNLNRSKSRDFSGSQYGSQDVAGHGSHCAGIVSAKDNEQGVLGMAPECTVIALKALSDQGSGLDTWSAAAQLDAITKKVDITTNSYGASGPMPATSNAMKQYIASGGIVIAAAGNGGPGSIDYPGKEDHVISVAAVDRNKRIAPFSSQNKFVDVCGSGVQVLSTVPGGRYAQMSGTSMACPSVAGAIACAFSALDAKGVKRPTQAEIISDLPNYCEDLGRDGADEAYGWGLFRADLMVEFYVKKAGGTDPKPPVPPVGKFITIDQLKAAGYTGIIFS
jgi:subtilisin family serine protease